MISLYLIAECDGCSLGNPGPAGIGVVLRDSEGKTVRAISECARVCTCNTAEYKAILRAVQEAKKLGATRLLVHSDSKLVVSQLNGDYAVNSPRIGKLHAEVLRESRELQECIFHHQVRTETKKAHELAQAGAKSGPQVTVTRKMNNEAASRALFRGLAGLEESGAITHDCALLVKRELAKCGVIGNGGV